MCGRYTFNPLQGMTPDQLRLFGGHESKSVGGDGMKLFAGLERTWNVAPTRKVPVVRVHPTTGTRELVPMLWGLVPSWAKDLTIGSKLINARGETVAEKPAFRAAFRKRRCLMLTTGFYEWQNAGTKASRPWFIRVKDQEVFAFAGIWESWENKARPELDVIETCAIITIEANETMQQVHHRMPVILSPDDYEAWLDPARHDPTELLAFVKPCPAEWLTLHPVSTKVNNPRNDGADLIEPER
ncbi:MAG: SOS response-associated peptidase [Candidatus Coatesbacteria bacterium]